MTASHQSNVTIIGPKGKLGLCLLTLIFTLVNTVFADTSSFTLTIAALNQSNQGQFTQAGLPLIPYPGKNRSQGDRPKGESFLSGQFFVIIQNRRDATQTMDMLDSDWDDCLNFVLTDDSGNSWHVARQPEAWTKNNKHSWVFLKDGIRIIPINLADRWNDLPPMPAKNELFHLTATFHGFVLSSPGDSPTNGHPISITSAPTDIYLSPQE